MLLDVRYYQAAALGAEPQILRNLVYLQHLKVLQTKMQNITLALCSIQLDPLKNGMQGFSTISL